MNNLLPVFALLASFSPAQEPAKPADPAQLQAGGKAAPQPAREPFGATRPLSSTLLLSYEENLELLEAQRDTKKAHIRAAEVAVKAAEMTAGRLEKLGGTGLAPQEELAKAKLEVEAAKAQVEIRAGEMKEIEIRIKYAKKRLDEAKAAVRAPAENPFRKADRKAVDPVPPPAGG